MELVDTHCHIQSVGLQQGERTTRELWAKATDLTAGQILSNARDAGVSRMICVGCDLEDSRLAMNFVQKQQGCWSSLGIHPHEAGHYAAKQELLEDFASLIKSPKVVAIGECGFDFYYNHSPKDAQTEVLRFQMQLAQDRGLPVVFHVRDAYDAFWPVFDSFAGLRGVLHSFTDNRDNLQKALERGLYIGVNGIATFTKSEAQLEVYQSIPLNRLLLETDAPFLTPTPYRGTINQPKNIREIAEFVSRLKGVSLEDLAAQTTANAQQLFGME